MKFKLLAITIILCASNSTLLNGMANPAQKRVLLLKQIGFGTLGTAAAASTLTFGAFTTTLGPVFDGLEWWSSGGQKPQSAFDTFTGTSAFFTGSSFLLSMYSFGKVWRLQKRKGLLK